MIDSDLVHVIQWLDRLWDAVIERAGERSGEKWVIFPDTPSGTFQNTTGTSLLTAGIKNIFSNYIEEMFEH